MTPSPGSRPGRNEPCHCGSGRKYKQCCLEKDDAEARAARVSAQAAEATAEPPAAETARTPPRPPRPTTHQPWKKAATQGVFHQKVRTPRKVGGS